MKKLLIALLIVFVGSTALAQRAGHNKTLTFADFLNAFYLNATPGCSPAAQNEIFDTSTVAEWANLAGNIVTKYYPASETLDYIGCTGGIEVYDFNNDDVSEVAYVFAIDADDYRNPVQLTSLDKLGLHRRDDGIPGYYTVWGNQLYVAPVNYDTDSLVVHYYATNNWLGDSSSASADTSNIEYPFLNLWVLTAAEIALNAKLMNGEGQYRSRLEDITRLKEKEEAKFQKINIPFIQKVIE